jgi:hypothetical protein
VRGLAQLGHGMGIQTAAECVETQAVCDRLRELGIDRAQGFYFGQPLVFERVLETRVESVQTLTPAIVEKLLTESVVVRAEAATPRTEPPTARAEPLTPRVDPAAAPPHPEHASTRVEPAPPRSEPAVARVEPALPRREPVSPPAAVTANELLAAPPPPSPAATSDAAVNLDNASELEELMKSAEELHAQSQQLKLATENLTASGEPAGGESDTVQQPTPHLSGTEPTVEHPLITAANSNEPTVEQPQPSITATG